MIPIHVSSVLFTLLAGTRVRIIAACENYCSTWSCDADWCAQDPHLKPEPCQDCKEAEANPCAEWCAAWTCDGDESGAAWCSAGQKPAHCQGCDEIAGNAAPANEQATKLADEMASSIAAKARAAWLLEPHDLNMCELGMHATVLGNLMPFVQHTGQPVLTGHVAEAAVAGISMFWGYSHEDGTRDLPAPLAALLLWTTLLPQGHDFDPCR